MVAPVAESPNEPQVSIEVTPRKALLTETFVGPTVTDVPHFRNDLEIEVIKVFSTPSTIVFIRCSYKSFVCFYWIEYKSWRNKSENQDRNNKIFNFNFEFFICVYTTYKFYYIMTANCYGAPGQLQPGTEIGTRKAE